MSETSRWKQRKTWLWIGGAVAVIAVIALVVTQRPFSQARAQSSGTGDIVTVGSGDLAASATASGKVEAQRSARLALNSSGTVAQVFVDVGDSVQAGDPLLALETAELERAVANAEQTLTIQEANLASLVAPADAAEIASAQASLASAQAQLNDLMDGPNPDEVAAAEADVRAAEGDIAAASARLNDLTASANAEELQAAQLELELAQQAATEAAQQHSTILVTDPDDNPFLDEEDLEDMEFNARVAAVQANADLAAAQEALDELQNGDPNSIAAARASVALAQAQRDAAQAQLDLLLQDPSAARIAAAESQVAQAEAELDRLQRGPTGAQIAVAESQVEQARIALERAQRNLADATLYAPFDGVVTAVYVNAGEQAQGILVDMVDPDSLEVVLDVDEVDIGSITPGQEATITLEAWPEEEITAQVAAIAPEASDDNSDLVTYEVYLSIGETERPVRVGMTANADLVTAQRDDVLLAPNAAIQVNRNQGVYTVNRVVSEADGEITTEPVTVTIGLRDREFTQITGGLSEGDRLLIGNDLPVFSFGNGGPPPFAEDN